MKKLIGILCLLSLIFTSIPSYGQLNGSGSAITGEEIVIFSTPPFESWSRYTWSCSPNLQLKTQSVSSATFIATKPGSAHVNQEFTDGAGRIIHTGGGFLSIAVLPDPGAPKVNGPHLLKPDTEYEFTAERGINSQITWDFPKKYFKMVGVTSNGGIEKAIVRTLDINIPIGEKISGDIYVSGHNNGYVRIGLFPFWLANPDYKISPMTLLTCDVASYEIEGLDGTEKIQWSSPMMTITSGQGKPKSTFKANSTTNGYVSVKATIISQKGKVFNLENSSVWVGKPKVQILGFESGEFKPSTLYRFSAYDESSSSTSYKWSVKGDARLETTLLLPSGASGSVMTNNPRLGGSFSVYLTATNVCGEAYASRSGNIAKSTGGGIGGGDNEGEAPFSFSLEVPLTYNIEIYTFPSGTLVKKLDNVANFNIQDLDLNRGTIYLVKKTDKEGNVTSEKMMLD